MRWKLPWPKLAAPKLDASDAGDDEQPDGWQRHVEALHQAGIPEPGAAVQARRPATMADEQALYEVAPSFVELLPWVEFLPQSKAMLLEDGQSVAAFYELVPLGTEGREPGWLAHARDALENALQDSFDELDENPWVLQLYAQDEPSFDQYMQTLRDYVQPRARDTAFTEFYLRFFGHHLRAVAKPGGLFEDTVVTRLRWRGQTRRVRMVVYRRVTGQGQNSRRGQTPEQMLNIVCDRLCGGLANAGIQARRMVAADVHDWLLRWFNPRPTLLGPGAEDRERFYALARYPDSAEDGEDREIELASGRDFSQRLFFGQPRSDVAHGTWYFDGMPHRVLITDRLRMPPGTGHLTGETRKGDAINTLFDQMPEDTLMCLTMVATPQDVLEADLNYLAKKAVGETLASEQTLKDVHEARSLIGSAHKLYRGTLAFYLRGRAAGLRPHRPARFQIHPRRPGLAARERLGGRPATPPALRRQAGRHLRRAADARPRDPRSARHRRRGGQQRRFRLARFRDHARTVQATAQCRRRAASGRCGSRGARLRNPLRRKPWPCFRRRPDHLG